MAQLLVVLNIIWTCIFLTQIFDNCFCFVFSPITESTEGGSASVKKEKEKKNRKKDKENGSGSEAGNQENFDAPNPVVGS